ncbi:metallophosphoesterase [Humibacter sp. RRB41]|uniref:metallophosphoesterase n=1 Tax=Humibacter sp. RRB41 TaxID=2919946 RepID=UPI001FAA87CA|nr:metallophosphoesterase [Humibacter sp. RRB41]
MTASHESSTRLRLLHISDTHLFGDDSLHYDIVDTTAALKRVLARASQTEHVDVVVLSGDLSEDGTPAAYRRLRDLVEPWAAERGAQVVYAMGNHDLPDAFTDVLGDRRRVIELGGHRIVVLDSSVPGAAYGSISAEQLAWLSGVLSERAELGTTVVLHHPPTPAVTPLLHLLELDDPHALLNVLEGSDVRLVLSGHYHHPLVALERGIPIVVAPGVTNTSDVTAPAGVERATIGAGFAIVDVPASGSPRVSIVTAPSPRDGELVFELDAAEIRRIADGFGAPA